MGDAIQVDFCKPVPVFPLPGAVLLPHAVQPLKMFESRYCQMIEDCLDSAGQIAMATFRGEDWKKNYEQTPPLRPAVCIGQVVHHEHEPDGCHHVLLQGVCRARVVEMMEPEDGRLYRMARVTPIEAVDAPPSPMPEVRAMLRRLLEGRRLRRMSSVETVMKWFERDDVSTHALLELIGFVLLKDTEIKYRLLEEASADQRARIIRHELITLDRLVWRAEHQDKDWPRGMSWN